MAYPEIEQYINDPSSENEAKLYNAIGDERFKVSEIGITSRVFTHWKQNGIIPELEDRKWVRLNLVEYFWLKIVMDLRELGLPLERIAKVKEQLFNTQNFAESIFNKDGSFRQHIIAKFEEEGDDAEAFRQRIINDVQAEKEFNNQENSQNADYDSESSNLYQDILKYHPLGKVEIPIFYGVAFNTLFRNVNQKLVIDLNGNVSFMGEAENDFEADHLSNDLDEIIHGFDFLPLTVIPLKKYTYEFLSEPLQLERVKRLGLLNEVEQEVITTMRKGEVSELKIIFDKNDNHNDLIFTYKNSVSSQDLQMVMDKFISKKHVGLTMKSNDGKTVHFEYMKRKRFTSEQ